MHILIVGAGVAGLCCARDLLRNGYSVTLLEASDAVGGRVRSDEREGFVLDHGFQVLFDAYPAARRQLDLAALDLRYFDPGAIVCREGWRQVLSDPLRDPGSALGSVFSTVVSPLDKLLTLALAFEMRAKSIDEVLAGEDAATIDFLRQRGFSRAAIDNFFRPFYGGIFLDRSLETSAKCFKFDFKMLSDGGTCVPARGMGRISEQLATDLVAADCIRLGKRVSDLLSDGDRVLGVRLANGTTLAADAVVLATPAPEAARLSGLPLPLDHVQTVTLYFRGDEPFYHGRKILLNAEPDAFVNNAQLMSNVAPEYAPAGQHLLSASVLGMPPLDDEELFARALADLRRMFAGDTPALRALASYQPLAIYRIAYAQFAQPPGLHPNLPANRSRRPGLYFAAEFTEASSINAAMISGEKCAAAIGSGPD